MSSLSIIFSKLEINIFLLKIQKV